MLAAASRSQFTCSRFPSAAPLRRRLGVLALLGASAVLPHPVPTPAPAAATPAAASQPGLVLHETHTQSQVVAVDTIVTFVTARRVRVSHASGHTILDLQRDRIVLLDPAQKTYKEMPLQEWEARVEAAVGAREADDAGPFEAVEGEMAIAGYACDRFHYYGKRRILDTEEFVEQQIWVARALEVPAEGYEAYRRALESIESIGSGRLRRRPPGIVLGVETRTQRAGDGRDTLPEIERNTVFRVEKIDLPDSLFMVPADFVPSDSAAARPSAVKEPAPRGAR